MEVDSKDPRKDAMARYARTAKGKLARAKAMENYRKTDGGKAAEKNIGTAPRARQRSLKRGVATEKRRGGKSLKAGRLKPALGPRLSTPRKPPVLRNHEDLVEGNFYCLAIEGGGQRLVLRTKYERTDVGTKPHIFHVSPFDRDSNCYGMSDAQIDRCITAGIVYAA